MIIPHQNFIMSCEYLMRIKTNILIFVCLLFSNSWAQNIIKPNEFFTTVFENANRINPYHLCANPAFLHFDNRDQLLAVNTIYSNNSGEFKTFNDPGSSILYQLNFSGKKVLDDSQVFKGSFAVQRLERQNWDFIVTRNYNNGSPFLLADSTSGTYRYNGILLNTEYAVKLSSKLLAGFGFNYGVDDGLKEVAPRPTSSYRDIDATLGAGYLFNEQFGIGASVRIYDFNEEIKYREDEGAVFQETILFKFRGYDFPFRVTKKVETRLSYQNGYFSGVDLFLNEENFKLTGTFGGGFEHLVLKDDVLNPKTEGYWKNNKYYGNLQSSLIFSQNLSVGILYSFNNQESWSKHPEFDVLLAQDNYTSHFITTGLELKLNDNTKIGSELGMQFFNRDASDFYSGINWDARGTKLISKLGIINKFSDYLTIMAGFGYDNNSISDSNLDFKNPSIYFTDFRNADILYYQTNFQKYSVYLKTIIYPASIGYLNFYFSYERLNPNDSFMFNDKYRNNFSGILELRLNVY
jgi:hypothetical protein